MVVGLLTSGKVPLEKTLMKKAEVSKRYARRCGMVWSQWKEKDLHKETGLSAGTVTNDDELASDFSHAEPVYTSARLALVG